MVSGWLFVSWLRQSLPMETLVLSSKFWLLPSNCTFSSSTCMIVCHSKKIQLKLAVCTMCMFSCDNVVYITYILIRYSVTGHNSSSFWLSRMVWCRIRSSLISIRKRQLWNGRPGQWPQREGSHWRWATGIHSESEAFVLSRGRYSDISFLYTSKWRTLDPWSYYLHRCIIVTEVLQTSLGFNQSSIGIMSQSQQTSISTWSGYPWRIKGNKSNQTNQTFGFGIYVRWMCFTIRTILVLVH